MTPKLNVLDHIGQVNDLTIHKENLNFQLFRLNEVLSVTGVSKSTHYDQISKEQMTPPVALGERAVGWPSYEIFEINRARISGADTTAIKQLVIELVEQRKSLWGAK